MKYHTPLVLIAALLVSGPSADAIAQAPEPVRHVVPYTGHLDHDGAPFDGQAAVRFRLYDRPVEGEPLWAESHPAVSVRAGRFAVRLGEQPVPEGQPGITALASSGAQLYLELAVAQPAPEGVEPDWTALAGRQAIHPVPQAVWTATGSDLRAASLTVDGRVDAGSLEVGGRTGTDSLAVAGSATVGSQLLANTVRVLGNINNTAGPVVIGDDLQVNGRITTATLRDLQQIGNNAFGRGAVYVNGPSTDNHFCALARVWTDGGNDDCYVQPRERRWDLLANDSFCVMYCYRFAD